MKVEIYGREGCPYCEKAVEYASVNDLLYTYYDITKEPVLREAMLKRNPSAKTVPQIFIDNKSVGGYDDMINLLDQDF